jgi:predicted DNA binding protein
MHEFRFSITYEEGADPYADAFIEHDSLSSRAVYACLRPTELWRLETVEGGPEVLGRVTELLLDESIDRLSFSERDCRADRRHSLLNRGRSRRTVYSHFADVSHCDAVPVITAEYTSAGSLIERTQRGSTARWYVLLQDDEKVGMLYDTLGGRLRDGLTFEFDHLTRVDGWQSALFTPERLPAEQQETLTLAVERGYFETPREVSLDELADELDTPRSTVSYRLRRATAELATKFVERRS